MHFAIIKERKNPPDRRVDFSPEKLKELNCCYGQGYNFFPPLKSEIITTLLQEKLTQKKEHDDNGSSTKSGESPDKNNQI